MKKFAILVCLSAFALLSCTSKITGTLQVDGAPFDIKQCRSGQAFGFSGIELTDASGNRLRVLANADGTCTAALFKGDSPTGDRLGQCGTLVMAAQSSRINSIVNVKGTAKLSCEAVNHRVSGTVDFENCH